MPSETSCPLSAGLTGQFCEINVDDCEKKPCGVLSICKDTLNGYSCFCAPGFIGKWKLFWSYFEAILHELKWHFIHRNNVSTRCAPFMLSQEITARLKWMNVSASLVKMEAPALMSSTHSAASVLLESKVFYILTVTVFCLHNTAQTSMWQMMVGRKLHTCLL